jgi:hypothetical protein
MLVQESMTTATWMLGVLAVVGLGACVDDSYTKEGFAPLPADHAEIQACAYHGDCDPLCVKVFGLTDADDIQVCRIRAIENAGAHVVVKYIGDDDSGYDDDSSFDDGTIIGGDDGSDDGSAGDGSDDGSDDGSAGDDGSDDGSSTGGDDGGDDGTSRKIPLPVRPVMTVKARL